MRIMTQQRRTPHNHAASSWVTGLVAMLAASAAVFAGPIDTLYFIDPGSGRLVGVQGSAVVFTTAGVAGSMLAVDSTVRTYAGAEYTLAGNATGNTYTDHVADNNLQWLDGTSDGTHNYAIGWDQRPGGTSNDRVYRFNSDWTAPTILFTAPVDTWGISYDPGTGHLWTSSRGGNLVSEFLLNGTLVSSFTVPFAPSALALDPGDGTLWMNEVEVHGAAPTFYQYSKSGTLLSSQTYAALAGTGNIFGAEFSVSGQAATPEPSGFLLLGSGLAVAGLWQIRRRTAAL